MVIDAGGGTVDFSSYHFLSSTPVSVEEVAPPDCKCIPYRSVSTLWYTHTHYVQVSFKAQHALTPEPECSSAVSLSQTSR